MATTPQDNLKYSETNVSQYPNPIGNVIHSGDMVFVDTKAQGTSTYNIKALSTDAQAAAFAGISMDTYDPTNYGVYANDPAPPNGMNVQRDGVWAPYGTSGETYLPGTKVYIGADAQTITLGTTANSNVVGYVYNPGYSTNTLSSTTAGVAAPGQTATGTGTTQILCWIATAYPATFI